MNRLSKTKVIVFFILMLIQRSVSCHLDQLHIFPRTVALTGRYEYPPPLPRGSTIHSIPVTGLSGSNSAFATPRREIKPPKPPDAPDASPCPTTLSADDSWRQVVESPGSCRKFSACADRVRRVTVSEKRVQRHSDFQEAVIHRGCFCRCECS